MEDAIPFLPQSIKCPDSGEIIYIHQVSDVDARTYSRFTSEYDLTTEEFIGSGEFGIIVRCKNRIDSQAYAIKKISIGGRVGSGDNQDILRESAILGLFDHPNIVRYYTTWMENTFAGSTGDQDIEKGNPCIYIQQQLCDREN